MELITEAESVDSGNDNPHIISEETTIKRILLVDDHPVFRLGLSQLITTDEKLSIFAEAESMEEALRSLEDGSQPDLVTLDVSLGSQSGLELTRNLRKRFPDLPILCISMHDEMIYAERSLRAGATGYLMKSVSSDQLLSGIQRAIRGEVVVSERVSNAVLARLFHRDTSDEQSVVASLSDRELQIFEMIGTGARTREIADRLSISAKTVDTHKAHIKRKLRLERSTDLLRAAMGWVSDRESAV